MSDAWTVVEVEELLAELVHGWDMAELVLGLKLKDNPIEAKTRDLLARIQG